jgi:hypothetical protein
MKVLYNLNDVSTTKMIKCIGDLLRHVGETTYKLKDDAEAIRKSKTLSSIILNKLRRGKGMGGITVDNLLTALDATATSNMISFKVNGVNLCDTVKDKKDIELEITVDENFFMTRMLVDSVLFKTKNPDEALQKQKDKWISWFEKNLREYHPLNKCTKTIMEK